MYKRVLVSFAISLLPTFALADTSVYSPQQQSSSASYELGGSSDPTSSSVGGTSLLQPTSGSNPQTGSSSSTGGSGSDASSALQDPASSSQTLQVLAGSVDGGPVSPSGPSVSFWAWLWLLIVAVAFIGGSVYLARTQAFTPLEEAYMEDELLPEDYREPTDEKLPEPDIETTEDLEAE